MDQQNIRPYNGQQYSISEGAAIIAELDARTKNNVPGYNSISEITERILEIINNTEPATIENQYSTFNDMIADRANQTLNAIQFVEDASGDPETSGSSINRYYEYLGNVNGDNTDWRLMTLAEGVIITSGSMKVGDQNGNQFETAHKVIYGNGFTVSLLPTGGWRVDYAQNNSFDLGEFDGADLAAAKLALENAHPTPLSGSYARVNPLDGDPVSAYWDDNSSPNAWKYGNSTSVQTNGLYLPQTVSQSKVLTATDHLGLLRVNSLKNIIIPEDSNENLPIGFRTIVKRAQSGIVSFFGQLGVTIEIEDGFEKEVASQFSAIELVKEAANTWGVYGALALTNPDTGNLPYPLVLDVANSVLSHVAWMYVFKSSDCPIATTTKDYFCIYSTDHDTAANGAIAWAEMDDPELNGFEEQGIIVQNGHQSEFGWLIFMPAAESGLANDELFLYFHTEGEPGNAIGQETRLWTTVGGAPLHTATWTDRGRPLTVEVGDNHNGYMRMWKRGVSDYIAQHLIIGAGSSPFTDQQAWATTPDGLNFTRGGTYSLNDNMPSGGTFWRMDLQPFFIGSTLYGLINYNNAGVHLALVELDPVSYLPQTFVKILITVTFADFTMYEESGVLYIYFRNKGFTNTTFPIENSLYVTKLDLNSLV